MIFARGSLKAEGGSLIMWVEGGGDKIKKALVSKALV
jgi:hypothetical protein